MSKAPRTKRGISGTTSILQLIRERRTRGSIYHRADYWNARASARDGLARSVWPSNVFNTYWNERQCELLDRALGDISGLRIVDVGCGTGRMVRHFARRGAREVAGIDFSLDTVSAAKSESLDERLSEPEVRFHQGDAVATLDHVGVESFDVALVLGCFSVACRDVASLERAFANTARLLKPGGRLLLLEPIHRSPLLRRVLDLGLEEWIAAANRAGLALEGADRMGFAPVRLVLAVRDLPHAFVAPVFRAGEKLLDEAPFLAALSDYKLLMFRKTRA